MNTEKIAKRSTSKLSALFLALVMILSSGFFTSVFAINDGDIVNYTTENAYYLPIFTVDGGYTGTCSELGNPFSLSGSASVHKVSNNTKTAKIQYYYGYKQGWINNFNVYPGFQSVTYAQIYLDLTQICGQGRDTWEEIAPSHGINPNRVQTSLALYDGIDSLVSEVPSGFTCFAGSPSDGSQSFTIWQMTPTGKLVLKKESANPSITG